MAVSFSHPAFAPVAIPRERLLGVFSPRTISSPPPPEELLEGSLRGPLGSPPLKQLVPGAGNVLVLVDDITRQTPVAQLLPRILRELEEAGAGPERVSVLVACGTHTPASVGQVRQRVSSHVFERYRVEQHYWKNANQLEDIGKTASGCPVVINKKLRQAQLVLAIGSIVPHRVVGFTGGGTIVQPGVCGAETTGWTHWLSAQHPGEEIMGKPDNPVRLEIEAVARKAGLRFIVNAVLDAQQRVAGVYSGDPVQAHRAGCRRSAEIFSVQLPHQADIVLIESYPADYDLWQAAKGIYSANLAVRPGGVIVLLAPCPFGVSKEHPEVLHFGYRTLEEVRQLVADGKISDLAAAAHLVHVGEVIRKKARAIMVSTGISVEEQRKLGFLSAATPQEGLDRAMELEPQGKVAVILKGGNVYPEATPLPSAAGRSPR